MNQRTDHILLQAFVWSLYAVLLIPLLIWHDLIFPFITLKVFVFQAFISLLAVLWAALLMRGEVRPPRWTPVTITLATYIVSVIVSALAGVDLMRSLWSTQERGIGVIALVHFVLLAIMLDSARGRINWERYWLVSIGASVVAALFAFVHLVNPPFFFDSQPIGGASIRPGSFLGNPSYLASYLLPHIFLAAYLVAEYIRRNHWTWAAVIAASALVNILVVFLTQTRGALLGLLVGAFVLIVYGIKRGRTTIAAFGISWRMVGIATLIFAMITTTAFWLTQSLAVWQSIPGVRRLTNLTLDSPEIQPRLIALGIALQAFKEHPLLGFGFENFKYAFDPRYDPRLLRQGFGETFFDRPHNVILEYAVGGGAIGLLAYLVLVGTIGILMTKRAELRTFAPFGVALLLAHIAQNLFLFDTFGSYLVFFILAAFVSSRSSPEGTISHEVAGERSFRGKQTAAVLIVGCVALAWVVANVGIVYANHKQYWGFNYFVNSLPEDALASYTRALSVPVNPYRDSMKKDLVSVLVQMHTQGLEIPDLALHVKESMAELERVIERHPKDYFVRISYADAATVFAGIDRNFLQQGMDAIGVALTLSPGRQQAYYILGKLDLLSGDTAGALAAMQKAIDLDPEIGESHFYFALIAFEAEKTSEAFVALETAKQLGRVPKNSGELRIVANHYADAGNYGEAIKLYNQSLEKEPADLETKLKLGIVYLYAGDKEAARRYIGEVAKATDLTKAPSYPLLKPILDELGISYKPK